MTRYARAKGSKACNSKQISSATPWNLLKKHVLSKNSDTKQVSSDGKLKGNGGTDCEAEWYDFIAERKCEETRKEKISKKCNFQRRNAGKREALPDESIKESSSKKLIREVNTIFKCDGKNDVCDSQQVRDHNTTLSNVESTIDFKNSGHCSAKTSLKKAFTKNKHIQTAEHNQYRVKANHPRKEMNSMTEKQRNDLSDLRRKEKVIKREKKKVCFCCRRWGHQLAECPEIHTTNTLELPVPSGGFCYNCGSTEHKVSQCSKTGSKTLKFARCFVCGEEGHLARLCPNNPKGTYPKGGACLICGEVNHMRMNCPKAHQDHKETENSLTCMTSGPVDSLPEDLRISSISVNSVRVVQF